MPVLMLYAANDSALGPQLVKVGQSSTPPAVCPCFAKITGDQAGRQPTLTSRLLTRFLTGALRMWMGAGHREVRA